MRFNVNRLAIATIVRPALLLRAKLGTKRDWSKSKNLAAIASFSGSVDFSTSDIRAFNTRSSSPFARLSVDPMVRRNSVRLPAHKFVVCSKSILHNRAAIHSR